MIFCTALLILSLYSVQYTIIWYVNTASPCTIASKINVNPIGAYLPISKLRSILPVANLLALNKHNVSQICYCGQISLQSAAAKFSFSDNLTH